MFYIKDVLCFGGRPVGKPRCRWEDDVRRDAVDLLQIQIENVKSVQIPATSNSHTSVQLFSCHVSFTFRNWCKRSISYQNRAEYTANEQMGLSTSSYFTFTTPPDDCLLQERLTILRLSETHVTSNREKVFPI